MRWIVLVCVLFTAGCGRKAAVQAETAASKASPGKKEVRLKYDTCIVKTLDELKALRKAEDDDDTEVTHAIKGSSRVFHASRDKPIELIKQEGIYSQIVQDGFRGWIESSYVVESESKPSTPKTELVPLGK